MAGDAGFVLAEEAADFRKRFFFGVVEPQAVFFERLQAIERGLQSAGE